MFPTRPPPATTPIAEKTVRCVILFPKRAEDVGKPRGGKNCTELGTYDVPASLLDTQNAVPCPVSAALGVPLKMAPWPTAIGKRVHHGANWLFLQVDPEDSQFGRVEFETVRGAIILTREDGRDLRHQYVAALKTYVERHIGELNEHLMFGSKKEEDGSETNGSSEANDSSEASGWIEVKGKEGRGGKANGSGVKESETNGGSVAKGGSEVKDKEGRGSKMKIRKQRIKEEKNMSVEVKKERVAKAKELAGRVFCKQAFRTFLKEYKRAEMVKGAQGWQHTDIDELTKE